MRPSVLAFVFFAAGAAAVAAPPRGKRTARPKPTHVVLAEAKLDAGAGVTAIVKPGVGVAVKGGRAGAPAKGKAKVTVVGGVELSGQLDGALLGARAAREVELAGGKVREGALLRLTGGAAPRGQVAVETTGEVVLSGLVPADALTAEPREMVFAGSWSYRAVKAVAIYPTAEAKGTPLGKLAEGARVEFVEQQGGVAKVETYGGVRVAGWVEVRALRARDASDTASGEPRLISPTHEMFVDGPIFAAADGKKRVGTLRGGQLVEVVQGTARAGHVKVTTPSEVVVTAWVREADLRPLDTRMLDKR